MTGRATRLALILLGTLLPAGMSGSADADETTTRPNIVLILADDMGFECLGANGAETYTTPHLDRLARTGIRFTHCYSQPLCTPSRVKLMTGRYNSRNYIRFGLLDPKARTFAHLLRDAGYATCVAGKWQLGGGFDGPKRFGFDRYCLWQLTRRPNRYANPGLEIDGKEMDFRDGQYGPDIVHRYACAFIREQAKRGKPFFLYYPMILPHWPFEPTPDSPDWDPAFRKHDRREKSYGMRKRKHFVEMVRYLDRLVGRVVDELDKSGVRDKTLVLFTSDNGTYHRIVSRFRGRPWKGGKGRMTDAGTRVPLVANWPGTIPKGRVCRDLVDFTDFLPTLAEAAGVSVPDSFRADGRSFFPQLLGKPGNPRRYIYCWFFRNGKPVPGGPEHKAGEWARTHRYKLYRKGASYEFYDLKQDPLERSPLPDAALSDTQRIIKRELGFVILRETREGFYDKRPRDAPPKPPALPKP